MGWLYGLSWDKEGLEVQSLCYLMHVACGNGRVVFLACRNSVLEASWIVTRVVFKKGPSRSDDTHCIRLSRCPHYLIWLCCVDLLS